MMTTDIEEQPKQGKQWKRWLMRLLTLLAGFLGIMLVGRLLLAALDFNDIVFLQEKLNIADTFFQVTRLILYTVLISLWPKIVDLLAQKKRISIKAAQLIKNYRLNVFLCCMIYELFFVHNVIALLFN
ncbi:hypothetical protein H0A36_17510 [Endozoicomonas sp. SM1973]|uniref:Uncharacterized protein n=1 Tax=Spartinivicinus marinus TaxID=2994442 RepID=A0A853ICM1_9GAMM|nr:hypothetical protein [Spartinivicinus marinus]MCX4030171.1 hypothetical protein [Spartinivicinus marinus]NYZ67814.1 hypothetical protein [Spartinivicinus marinus]